MAGWRRAVELAMSDEEMATLAALSRSRTELASRVSRAQMLLAYRENPSFCAVGSWRTAQGVVWGGLSVAILSGWFVVTRLGLHHDLRVWDCHCAAFWRGRGPADAGSARRAIASATAGLVPRNCPGVTLGCAIHPSGRDRPASHVSYIELVGNAGPDAGIRGARRVDFFGRASSRASAMRVYVDRRRAPCLGLRLHPGRRAHRQQKGASTSVVL